MLFFVLQQSPGNPLLCFWHFCMTHTHIHTCAQLKKLCCDTRLASDAPHMYTRHPHPHYLNLILRTQALLSSMPGKRACISLMTSSVYLLGY